MPIYEYACTSCGHRFELRQSFSDEPIVDCTKCGARVRRVLHPAGVIFKGSGWYATDSRPKPKSESSSSSDAAPSGDSTTSKKEPGAAKKEVAATTADD